MYYLYSLGIFIISVLVMWLTLRSLQKREAPSCRGYALGYLLAGAVPFAAALIITLLSSLYYFDGICYSFTDGSWDCSFWEYLLEELGYSFYFFMPAIGMAFVAITLSFTAHWFFGRRGYFQERQGGK